MDYIIEEGSNENGNYRKWNSGILEQWIAKRVTAAIDTSYINNVYTGHYEWTYPKPFASVDYVICIQARYDTGASWGDVNNYYITYADIFLRDLVSRTSSNKLYLKYTQMVDGYNLIAVNVV